eukprot:GAHX01002023.1.p1 GENE.GAHX01002023.1~~GAHX01002023.1.p1  ORF type:complete len:632 (-),score=140.72 GAHX01002023.1:25-1920(-)
MSDTKSSPSLEAIEKQISKEQDKKRRLELSIELLTLSNSSDSKHFSCNYKKLILKVLGFNSSSDTDIWKILKNYISTLVEILDESQLLYLFNELGSIASSNRYKGSILLKCFISSLLTSNSKHLEPILKSNIFLKVYFGKINYTRKLKIKSYKSNKKFDSVSLYSYIEPILKALQSVVDSELHRKVFNFIIGVITEENCNAQNDYNNGITTNSLSNRRKKIKRINLAYVDEDKYKKERKRIKCIENFCKNITLSFKLTEDIEIFNQIEKVLSNLANKQKDIEDKMSKQIKPIVMLFILRLIDKSFQYKKQETHLQIHKLDFVKDETKLNYLKLILKISNQTKMKQLDLEIRLFFLNFVFGLIKRKVIDNQTYIYNFSKSVLNSILNSNTVSLTEIPTKLKIIGYSLKSKILGNSDIENKLQRLSNFCIEYLEQSDTELGILDVLFVIFKNAQNYKFAEFYASTQELIEVLKLHFECEHDSEHIKKYYKLIKEYYKHISLFKGQMADVVTFCCRNMGADTDKNMFLIDILCEVKINKENIYDFFGMENKNEFSFIINELEHLLVVFVCILNLLFENQRQEQQEDMQENKTTLDSLIKRVDPDCKLKLEKELDLMISKNETYKEFIKGLNLFK